MPALDGWIRVFLSGGPHGLWRDLIVREFCGVLFYDPTGLFAMPDMGKIAETERAWLEETDVLFHFESANPSGLGSAFEVGYAVAKSIPVIFVDEKRTSHSERLAAQCDCVTNNIEGGIRALRRTIYLISKESR